MQRAGSHPTPPTRRPQHPQCLPDAGFSSHPPLHTFAHRGPWMTIMKSEFSQAAPAYAYAMHKRPAAGWDQPFSQGRATWTQATLPPPTARRRRLWSLRSVKGDRTGPGDCPRQVRRTAGGARRARWAFHQSRARLTLLGAASDASRPGQTPTGAS